MQLSNYELLAMMHKAYKPTAVKRAWDNAVLVSENNPKLKVFLNDPVAVEWALRFIKKHCKTVVHGKGDRDKVFINDTESCFAMYGGPDYMKKYMSIWGY